MAEWMLARDLIARPGEHPEQVEAAREHLKMGGFEGYERIDLTPQDEMGTLEWLEWRAEQGARSVDPRIIADALRKEGFVTGKEKLVAAGFDPEKIVECRQNEFPRVEPLEPGIVEYAKLFGLPGEKKSTDRPTVSVTEDEIENPAHYTKGIETIEYIESWGMDFRAANVIKYVTRHPYKGKPLSDLKKARWYIDRLIADLEGEL